MAVSVVSEEARRFFVKNPHLKSIGALDVETTGFARASKIVEIGMVRFDFDGINVKYSELSSLVKINEPIPPDATKVHGITDEMLEKHGASEEEIYPKLLEFPEGMDIVIGHNIPYDKMILVNQLARHGMTLGTMEDKFVCTLKLSRKALPHLQSHKLGDVAKHYGYSNEQAHRATDDSLTALYVYCKLMEA